MTLTRSPRALALVCVSTSIAALLMGAPPARATDALHTVTVVAAHWSEAPPTDPAESLTAPAAAHVNGVVTAGWEADTRGGVRFDATAWGSWVRVSTPACVDGRVADIGRIWNEVIAATGWREVARAHLLVVTPKAQCGGAEGVATQAAAGVDRSGLVWVNGVPMASVLAHELGHNLGLDHSNTLTCVSDGNRVTDAPAGSCISHEYMDLTDVMGISHDNVGMLGPVHLARLGLLSESDVTEITADSVGEFALPAYSGSERRILRLRAGSNTYYVIYRSASGRDSWLRDGGGFGDPGVAIYRASSDPGLDPDASYLLDAHVMSADADLGQARTVLDIGTTIRLPGDLLVTTVATDLAAARVWVGPRPEQVAPVQVAPMPPVMAPAPVLPPMSTPTPVAPQGPPTPESTPLPSPVAPSEHDTPAPQDGGPASVPTAPLGVDAILIDDAEHSRLRFRGQWRERVWAGAGGGRVHVSRDRGSSVRVRITGQRLRIHSARGKGFGRLVVRVDGATVATLNLDSARRVMGSVSPWIDLATSGSHTLVVVAQGNGPVVFDGVEVR